MSELKNYYCALDAKAVLLIWRKACEASTGEPDQWVEGSDDAKTYRWHLGHPRADGAATGRVFRCEGQVSESITEWTPAGGFRVEPSGKVTRAPRWLQIAVLRAQGAEVAPEEASP